MLSISFHTMTLGCQGSCINHAEHELGLPAGLEGIRGEKVGSRNQREGARSQKHKRCFRPPPWGEVGATWEQLCSEMGVRQAAEVRAQACNVGGSVGSGKVCEIRVCGNQVGCRGTRSACEGHGDSSFVECQLFLTKEPAHDSPPGF